jgi:hypothetical protein
MTISDLPDSGVAPNTYGSSTTIPVFTVNAKGQITAVTNTSITGFGTVTSVAVSGGTTGLTTSGGPITGSGTITLAGTLIAANGGTGISTYSVGDMLYASGTSTLSRLAAGTSGQVLTSAGAGAPTWATPTTGTVTSVGQTFTGGLISVAGSPVTSSGTLALTVAGTSGGVPYFSSASTWASSAALTANALVIGGGAGAAPATTTTGTGVVTALGANVGTAGAFVANGGALGTPSSGVATNLTGTASGLTAGTATNAVNSGITNDASYSGFGYFTWVDANNGNRPLKTTSSLIYCTPSTGQLFASEFNGSGEFLSNVSAIDSFTTQNAYITANSISGSTVYPTWTTGASTGDFPFGTSSAKLTFVPSTGVLSATGFAGAGTGLTGTAASLTAGTATNLAGGAASRIPYQTGAGVTSFLANGTAGQVLTSAGAGTPVWSGLDGGTF